ncbi:hypothetical protein [Streptomyces uncialis]|uniref:hypothetical protein n=1 Tax=Streptomyces uncialis TaxID=1048205 RepID=UPI002F936AD8|nr:hypothetical protein OG924_37120 [Streptomyces uncialis]
METRDLDLTHAEHTQHFPHPSPAPPTAGTPLAGLPYDGEGLRPIWDLFPDAHPHARTSPAGHQPAHNTALLLADDDYLARVHDLARREEALAHLGAHRERVLTPIPVPAPARLLPAPAAPQRVPAFVWKYSALALSTGGGVALAGIGVGAAAPGLAALEGVLAAAGQAVMSVAALILLIGLALAGRGTTRGGGAAGTTVNIRRAVFRRNKFHG